MHKWMLMIALGSLTACGSSKDKSPAKEETKAAAKAEGADESLAGAKDEASVEHARTQIAELDTKLASDDPESASSTCAVIKSDLPAIKAADAKLAETIERKCGRDLVVRALTVAVERVEKTHRGCATLSVYEEMITSANAGSDPEIGKLRERVAAACPPK